MKKWSYIIQIVFLWFLFSAGTAFLLFRFVLHYGKVEIKIDFTSYGKGALAIRLGQGEGWDRKKQIRLDLKTGRNIYTYKIRHLDTLPSFHIDFPENFDMAVLHSVVVDGLPCPIKFSGFEKNKHEGLRLMQKSDGAVLYENEAEVSPNIVINIPERCSKVRYKLKIIEIIYIILMLCFDITILIIVFRKKMLWYFMDKTGITRFFFISAFLLGISMFWLDNIFDFYPDQPNIENRRLEEYPDWKLMIHEPDSFFTRNTQWCFDHFQYRNLLIGSRSLLYISLFRQSPLPSVVIIGEKLTFFPALGSVLFDFMGKNRMSDNKLQEIIRATKQKHDLLAKYGIKFLIVLPPAKQHIYPELMPEYYRLQQCRPTASDQLIEEMNKAGIDYFIHLDDTLATLKKENSGRKLFYDYDTHWNEYGAFKAYQPVMAYIYGLDSLYDSPLEDHEVTMDTVLDKRADLAKCIIVNKKYVRMKFDVKPLTPDTVYEESIEDKRMIRTNTYYNAKGHGRLLCYRDSYMVQWASFFVHHFRESRFVWEHNMSMKEIMAFKPDVVLFEVGELFLDDLLIPIKTNSDYVQKKF
ncbi:MAG: hypothetical protein PHR81_09380 [Bacteroidales bacterium]|jgi:hypothetical protein|nr:hypothetical protein [Bacteroidales bacterium]MDD4215009.1 hypothetical protein [Bacteroidales bacterium]